MARTPSPTRQRRLLPGMIAASVLTPAVRLKVCLAFSCPVAAGRHGGGDFLHLAFSDKVVPPFGDDRISFGDCVHPFERFVPSAGSSYALREQGPRLLRFCRCAFWLGSRQYFPCCLDQRSLNCFRLLRLVLPQLYLLPRLAD